MAASSSPPARDRGEDAAARKHQHRFVPWPGNTNGPPRFYDRFACRCGAICTQYPAMRASEWRWKWLGENTLTRLWKRRLNERRPLFRGWDY